MEQLAQLDFVEACVHETMRLKPVGPLIANQALHDTVVGDVRVPADTVVWSVLRHDAFSEQYLPKALEFQPERWLAGAAQASPASSPSLVSSTSAKRLSMPFGAGPRICPGRYLAMLEMKLAIATLLGRFDIVGVDTPDGQEAREFLAFTMMPVGLSMRLKARD